jgi:outer membrane immunogenic protein
MGEISMKRLAVAVGLVLAGASVASAADLAVRPLTKAPLLSPIPVANWTGFYIGGFVGGTWATANGCGFTATVAACGDFNVSTIVGGGLVGYDYELPNRFVIGARFSAPFGGTTSTVGGAPFAPTASLSGKFHWATFLNATVGYDMGQWMPYAGLGVAFANLEVDATVPGGASVAQETNTGLNLLAGIRYQWNPSWELGLQYNHTMFARQQYFFTGAFAGGPPLGSVPIQITQDSLVGILDYKFR